MLRFPIATRYSDYDTKGHVNNAVYLTYFEWSRVQAWQQRAGGAGIAAADIADPPLIVAEGETVQVAYDYAAGRTMPISPEMRAALEGM